MREAAGSRRAFIAKTKRSFACIVVLMVGPVWPQSVMGRRVRLLSRQREIGIRAVASGGSQLVSAGGGRKQDDFGDKDASPSVTLGERSRKPPPAALPLHCAQILPKRASIICTYANDLKTSGGRAGTRWERQPADLALRDAGEARLRTLGAPCT